MIGTKVWQGGEITFDAQATLSHRLYSDPTYRELVKKVGYQGRPFPFSQEETEAMFAKHGKDHMKAAADELLVYDHQTMLAKLKDNVRKLCFGILGPAPEQEDWYCGTWALACVMR